MISYAQNFEDVLLQRIFSHVASGFYIDIGAYDPVIGSVTKAFYDRGWRGINIEPSSVFAKLAAARPRDINLQLAVWDKTGELPFFEDNTDLGTSHVISDQSAAEMGADGRLVPCDTLENIVKAYASDNLVNFLKIDAEGSELRIIRATDWTQLRPQVLLIEATAPWTNQLVNQEWEPILLEKGFLRAYFDGINVFYVRSEDADLLRHFDIPINVLDHFEIFDARKSVALKEFRVMEEELEITKRAKDLREVEYKQVLAQLEVARSEVKSWQNQTAAMQERLDELQSRTQQQLEILQPAATEQTTVRNSRMAAKKLLLPVYKTALAPIVRPLAWRIRSFLNEPHREQQERISNAFSELSDVRADITRISNQLAAQHERNGEVAKSIEALVATFVAQVSTEVSQVRADFAQVQALLAAQRERTDELLAAQRDQNEELTKSIEALILSFAVQVSQAKHQGAVPHDRAGAKQ